MSISIPGSVRDGDLLLVPIRMVQSHDYCPREAWYRFTLADDSYLNIHMEHGLRRHQTFDETRPEHDEGVVFRHLPVYAPELGVQGVLDELILTDELCTIVEIKASRLPRFVWPGVRLQVATQWLAIQEHGASERWLGPVLPERVRLRVYFSDSRRYREVPWTPELELEARAAIVACREILEASHPPPGKVGARCRPCQHYQICLPDDMPAILMATREERVS